MYRFGDGTPFPIEDNFLDTLSASIEACAAVFAAAVELDKRRERAREDKQDAEEEMRRLAAMEKAMEQALLPLRPNAGKTATASQQTAQRVVSLTRQTVSAARRELQQRIEASAAEPNKERAAERVREAMAMLFERCTLPSTGWAIRWDAVGTGAHAEAGAHAGKFRTAFDVAVDAPWNAPVRIGELVGAMRVHLPRQGLWGAPKNRKIALDRCALIHVEQSGERLILVVRTHPARPSPGWRIALAESDASSVIVVPINADGEPIGSALSVEGEDAASLIRIGEIAASNLYDLLARKRRLRELRIGDLPLEQIPEPATVGQAVLGHLAPLIRQIRAKSRVPGELVIKRDIGDGRREELFIPRSAIERRYAQLPPEYKRYFDEAGLGRDGTSEIQDTEVESAPKATTAPPVTGPTVTRASA